MARREFNKRPIDLTRADIRVSHGVVYVRGQLSLMRGAEGSLRELVEQCSKALRTRPEIRDVVIDAILREG